MSVATVAARSADSPPEARPIPLRRALRPRRAVRHLTFAGVALVVAGLVGVLPYDTWRNQSNDLHTAGTRLTALAKENTELQRQQRLLETDAEVSRIARQELGLAMADLWFRYFTIGGMSTALEVEAILYGALIASPNERDTIAVALNERFAEQGRDHPIPYSGDEVAT